MNHTRTIYKRSELLSMTEVVRQTGMGPGQINRTIAEGQFPRPIVDSGRLAWHASEIEVWLSAQRARPHRKFVGTRK